MWNPQWHARTVGSKTCALWKLNHLPVPVLVERCKTNWCHLRANLNLKRDIVGMILHDDDDVKLIVHSLLDTETARCSPLCRCHQRNSRIEQQCWGWKMMDCHFCDDILQSLSPKFSFGLSLWISCQVDSFCFPRLARSFFHSDSVFYTCGILLVVNEISSQICHHVRWMPVWILQWNDGQKTKCLLCWVRNSNRLRRSFHPSIHLAQISNTRGHKARRNGVARLCYWSWNYCPLLALPLFSASDLPSNWYFHVALVAKSGSNWYNTKHLPLWQHEILLTKTYWLW